ncbi:MAG: DNA repair protein RecN [Eubacterium sp.]|nr:DNA repair protein RecN [Eubacterium sp.]
MLVNLHVKNFAIIDEADIDFGDNFNVLTGETGAGKSILIGSLGIALGGRVSPEMIGRRGDEARVEAVFQIRDERTLSILRDMDILPEDDLIVISRRITAGRSVNKINGESVPVGLIRQVASVCIDIHGQNEHQSLLKTTRQREIVDRFGGGEIQDALKEVSELYHEFVSVKKEIEDDEMTDEELARKLDYLRFEKSEIETAGLSREEIEIIDDKYRAASNAGNVVESLSEVYERGTKNAADALNRVLPELRRSVSMNSELAVFEETLLNIESLLGDFNRDLSGFMQDYTFDENELHELEQRMDAIHGLQSKYGDSYDEIMSHLRETKEQLEQYEDYENLCRVRQEKYDRLFNELTDKCNNLHDLRLRTAEDLTKRIQTALTDLNFAHVEFAIDIQRSDDFSEYGNDEIGFLIATNPGEPVLPLSKIASGGELSRIMLAIKSVFADSDEIETLIFDEIDTGISGRTAQLVSEKMNEISRNHQVICITHLAQIAAMADSHFLIEKEVGADASETKIRPLDYEESLDELARILGGARITGAVRDNAREMKEMAASKKASKK